MNIEILNCNNIDYAKVTLLANKLNIKFAPNGSGKSTIARALVLNSSIEGKGLGELLPFKLKNENPDDKQPQILGAETLTQIMCFNEQYVNQFVFKADELVSNSFNIFIRTENYQRLEREIEELICKVKQLFSNNSELENLIGTLKGMGDAFKLTKTGLSKASTGMKAFSSGNKIQHIPIGLEPYTPFIQSSSNVKWLDWHSQGRDLLVVSSCCPFCTSPAADKMEHIKKVGIEYEKSIVKNLVAVLDVINKLGEFFSPEAREKLEKITTLKEAIENEHESFLVTVKGQIDDFTSKLEKLKTLTGFEFKDDVAEKLPQYKLNLQFFSELRSEKMEEAIAPINDSIDKIIEQAGILQGKINTQRKDIRKNIDRHQQDINDFLSYAGYNYAVEIVGEGEKSQLKLRHVDHPDHLVGGGQHLSFGEKNAFAIVLFMYECLSKPTDLIILDDPISSFDKNKKYAILEMLFRRDAASCLKSKTVLMLTHDVEPVIDTTKTLNSQFHNSTSVSFLKLMGGHIVELPIEKEDIMTFSQICIGALASSRHDIVKLIYLRRYIEILNDKDDAYQVISNLLHKRQLPIDSREEKVSGEHPKMDPVKFANGCSRIAERIDGFTYEELFNQISDTNLVMNLYQASTTGYEKLQIFRLIKQTVDNRVIQKFINETYHVENEFISQLDPAKYDTIPEHVIDKCDQILAAKRTQS